MPETDVNRALQEKRRQNFKPIHQRQLVREQIRVRPAAYRGNPITEVLRDSVKRYDVYTLDPDKFVEAIARLLLKDIEVQRDAVAFHLGF